MDREAAAGTRSDRSAHQELSLLIRSFVRDASGVDATRMTLAELRAGERGGREAPTVAPNFAGRGSRRRRDVPGGIRHRTGIGRSRTQPQTAREVVRSWN